ncbi:MAG: DUF4062 domain-containing protein [Planctomycetota bacterium]
MLLLHLSDLHFGNKNRFANDKPADLGRAFHRALQAARQERQIPDSMTVSLVIVTGDIAESGLPSEFRAALEFLISLAEEMKLSRDRFVFLPGNHDISWADCRIVRAGKDGEKFPAAEFEDRLNTEKLSNYRAFLSSFYEALVSNENLAELQNARPLGHGGWLRDFPDLQLSVAALNTSEREHDVSKGGFLSEEQAQTLMTFWLADAAASRLKIVALHHNPISTTVSNRDWTLEWLREKEKASGVSMPMSADVFEHYIADLAGFFGSEHLPKIVEDTCAHLVLHGHHHDQGKPTSWHWKTDGNAPVLSVGSFGLNKDQLPGDVPLSCQLIRFVLPPEPKAPRLVAIPLIYDGRFRLEGDILDGAFRAEVTPRSAYDQPLPLPSGWENTFAPKADPPIVMPTKFLGDHDHLSYDWQPVLARSLDELDQDQLKGLLARPLSQDLNDGLKGRDGAPPTDSEQLENLGCIYAGRPTLGALLCFAPKHLLTDKSQCCTLQMAIHDAAERGGKRAPIKLARGNLLQLYKDGMSWLTGGSVLRRSGSIGSDSRDDFEIPEIVLREALANALVHRDFESKILKDQPTRIDVYPDKIEITSYGLLLKEVSIELLNTPEQSLRPFRRNPVIAGIFQCMTLVELNASGVQRMHREMTERGLPLPLFRSSEDFVCVTLARPFELSSAREVIQTMPNAARKKRTAFISSTSADLGEHRKAAQDACLRAGVFPVVWEDTSANALDATSKLQDMVDEADIFICILGQRYGSFSTETSTSFTEMEFDRAVERGLPIFVFTMHQDHPVTREAISADDESREKLKKFKEKASSGRISAEFKSPEDLRGRIIEALTALQVEERAKMRFRVAFSFASEKRDFVAQVAAILANRFTEPAILYDKYHEAEFARSNLGAYLPKLYRDESELVVVVAGPDYEGKEWCGLEWTAIHALLKNRNEREVMLTRFERAEIPNLDVTAGFVELDHRTPDQAAALILERLALNEGNPKDHYANKPTRKHESATVVRPGTSATTTPNNLPRLHSFYGRVDELKKIAEALLPNARTWGVLIDGPGGMGKTSLAIRAAELTPSGQFKRILFLSAKEREVSADGERRLTGFVLPGYLEMLNEIARLLGQPELAKSIESERARLVLEALEPEQSLLILDNLESLTPEHRNQLFNFLVRLPPGCKAIVTSRRRTDVDARIIRLAQLDRDAALVFLEELATDRPLLAKASKRQRVELYEETGGNPLLLRWIAGQLGKGRCRSVTDALAFVRSAPPGNDPLKFIFGDLLETFTDGETKVLAALTYFTRAVEVNFIAELATLTQPAAQTALGDLASRALVVPDEAEQTFALVPMVADFLRRKRPEAVQQTGDRLADRAYALIVENGYDKYDRFPVLDAAWPTVAPAMPVFLAGPNERLQTVFDALVSFLEFTGRWDEWLALSLEAEAKAVTAQDFSNAGWRAYHAGTVSHLRGQSAEVLTSAERAAAHWREAQAGPRERAAVIRLRGIGHQSAKDYPAAIAAYREGVELWRTLGRKSVDVAIGLNDLADAERVSGDYVAAERDYREALRVANAVGYREGIANFTGNLAELALNREDWSSAETLAREALPLAEKLGHQELIAHDCHCLAKALAMQGRHSEGLRYAQRAVDIFTVLRSPHLQAARETLEECET